MSFQGDVAGLGLAELLQSIGRGDKEGVLSLESGHLRSRLGMRSGQVFPLPGPDEVQDTWRESCHDAWAEDPQPALETKRRDRLARAARVENLYRLIDEANVHFHFVPGGLEAWQPVRKPARPNIERDEAEEDLSEDPWGPGIPVEYLLLEHARLSDEAKDGVAATLIPTDVPRCVDDSDLSEADRNFLMHCDGLSTIEEIAARMGWTLTQARGTFGKFIRADKVRMSQARELIVLAQREMELGRFSRAASRLTGWERRCDGGPLGAGDLELLRSEWTTGRLAPTLHDMDPLYARAILRRLDVGEKDANAARSRWETLWEERRNDPASLVRTFLWRRRAEAVCESQLMNELLRLARSFQEHGYEMRARTLLRLAATQVPEKLSTRLELGSRLIDAGLVEEGSRWLVESARDLIADREIERASAPLRAVLRADPNHREAHGLLLETHAHSARRKRRKYGSIIALSIVLILASVAMVQMHGEQKFGERVDEITSLSDRPEKALGLLDRYFGDDESQRVQTLREGLVRRLEEEALRIREGWMQRYDEIRQECELGDPLLGLTRALQLPEPPQFAVVDTGPWPTRADLLNVLANHVQRQSESLNLPVDASTEDLHVEELFVKDLDDMMALAAGQAAEPDIDSFQYRLGQVRDELVERRNARALERERLLRKLEAREQDILLATARSHAAAGDFDRALSAYDRLLNSGDPADAEALRQLFGTEAQTLREHYEAFQKALELCAQGRHGDARIALEQHCDDLSKHLMPWRAITVPEGARITTRRTGSRVTPVLMHSAFGEPVRLEIELAGYETQVIELNDPEDVRVHLHRSPDRTWTSGHRVEAAPVPSGRDHVVADRAGRIARMDGDGELLWSRELKSLGGIARTPVFMPSKPGHLIFITEDGEAWMLDAASGAVEGPWVAGSPPRQGPLTTRSGVSALFEDGRVAVWDDQLEPQIFPSEETFTGIGAGTEEENGSLHIQVLRRQANMGMVLESRWTDWSVEVLEEEYRVRCGSGSEAFTVGRAGQWIYVAWESPNALIPNGRLWISDEAGLRAFEPDARLLSPGYE